MFASIKGWFWREPSRSGTTTEDSSDTGEYKVPDSPGRFNDGMSKLVSLVNDTNDDLASDLDSPRLRRGSSFSSSSLETPLGNALAHRLAAASKNQVFHPDPDASNSTFDAGISGYTVIETIYRTNARQKLRERRSISAFNTSMGSPSNSTINGSFNESLGSLNGSSDFNTYATRLARSTLRPENASKYARLHRDKEALLAEIKLWRETEQYKIPSLAKPKHVPVEPLPPKLVQLVEQYWRNMPQQKVLGEAYRVQLSVHDLRTLSHGKWLNDNVIDVFLADNTATHPKSFAFTTHFYTRLESSGYKAVGKWAKRKKINILELDHLFVPVNRGNMHWCLGAVDFRRKTITFYDSLARGPQGGRDVVTRLLEYLIAEADNIEPGKHEAHEALFKSFKQVPGGECPQQNNGSDCGVFMCQNVTRLVRGEPLSFTQKDMPHIRHRIAYRILELCNIKPT